MMDSRRDKLSTFVYIFSILSTLAQVSLLLASWGRLPPEVPIFYSRPWGEKMLAAPIFLWILPLLAFLCLIFNFLAANFISGEEMFLKRTLLIATLIVAITTLYGTVKIVSLLI